MKTFICTVATVLIATFSFFALHSVSTPEDYRVATCGKDTIAIEVDTLSPKATEMDSKPTAISLTRPLSSLETPATVETTTSEDNIESATTWTTPTTKVKITKLAETTPPVDVMELTGVITSNENTEQAKSALSTNTTTIVETTTSTSTATEVTTSATTETESELTKVTTTASSETTGSTSTTTFASTTESTSSSVTTIPCVRIYKTLTISDYFVDQTDVIPCTVLHLMLTDSESNCFTSEAEVAENGYVTFIFQSDDEHLITSGIYKCYCPELGTETTIELD